MVFTNEEAAMIEGVLSTYFTGANTAEMYAAHTPAYGSTLQPMHWMQRITGAFPMQLILQLRITSVKPAIERVSAS